MNEKTKRLLRLAFTEFGMVPVLVVLCVAFSLLTVKEQVPRGEAGAETLARQITRSLPAGSGVMICAGTTDEDSAFAAALEKRLGETGYPVLANVTGAPSDARQALEKIAASGEKLAAIAGTQVTARWIVFEGLGDSFPGMSGVSILEPSPYLWPDFLKRDNLLNIANQIAVIAIVAIGMTMVIITGGIDLSVGSLIALSAVVVSLLIRNVAGGLEAGAAGMLACCAAAILIAGLAGLATGGLITGFDVPPFIVTLAVMLIASGFAYQMTGGESVAEIPPSFTWLGVGRDFLGLPNTAVLMLMLYGVAHLVMSRTVLGRYLYAVGGNREAARLAGVPVRRVMLLAYAVSGVVAGIGGVVLASQLKSGSPTYGQMYELYVIAAVVVGGTSLSGGQGRMFGTLVGAFIMAVINNGMNLKGIDPFTQKIVLGAVILGAVLLDKLTHRQT